MSTLQTVLNYDANKQLHASLLGQWKILRQGTSNHCLCECKECARRRQLGAKLILPYAYRNIDELNVENTGMRE